MNKKLLILPILLLTSYLSWSQAVISIENNKHDFGSIPEEGGKVKHTFTIKNIGNKNLIIEEVKSPCGCTVPSWPKEPIAPGKEASINAVYDPMFRPGVFNKTLTIKTNAEPKNGFITIMGEVLPRERTFRDKFPSKNGSLRFKLPQIFFGKITSEKADTIHVIAYNDSQTPIELISILGPNHIKGTIVDKVIPPNKTGKFIIEYNPIKKGDFGFLNDQIILKTNDQIIPEKGMQVSAEIIPFQPALTPKELAVAPKIKVDQLEIDLGTINSTDVVKETFWISNEGEYALRLIRIKPQCGCTSTHPSKLVIPKGDKTSIELEFNPNGYSGLVIKEIDVYTNDPVNPKTTLRVRAIIEP